MSLIEKENGDVSEPVGKVEPSKNNNRFHSYAPAGNSQSQASDEDAPTIDRAAFQQIDLTRSKISDTRLALKTLPKTSSSIAAKAVSSSMNPFQIVDEINSSVSSILTKARCIELDLLRSLKMNVGRHRPQRFLSLSLTGANLD